MNNQTTRASVSQCPMLVISEFAEAGQKYQIRLSGTAITYISPCRFTAVFSRTAIAGTGSEQGGDQSEDCDCENCLSHFPGYFKLIMKAWFQVDQVYQRNGYLGSKPEAQTLGLCFGAKQKYYFQGTNGSQKHPTFNRVSNA